MLLDISPTFPTSAETAADFARLAGTLLLPHYHAIGGKWFRWVDAVAARGGAP